MSYFNFRYKDKQIFAQYVYNIKHLGIYNKTCRRLMINLGTFYFQLIFILIKQEVFLAWIVWPNIFNTFIDFAFIFHFL